jgi:hypothetical protein
MRGLGWLEMPVDQGLRVRIQRLLARRAAAIDLLLFALVWFYQSRIRETSCGISPSWGPGFAMFPKVEGHAAPHCSAERRSGDELASRIDSAVLAWDW